MAIQANRAFQCALSENDCFNYQICLSFLSALGLIVKMQETRPVFWAGQ